MRVFFKDVEAGQLFQWEYEDRVCMKLNIDASTPLILKVNECTDTLEPEEEFTHAFCYLEGPQVGNIYVLGVLDPVVLLGVPSR